MFVFIYWQVLLDSIYLLRKLHSPIFQSPISSELGLLVFMVTDLWPKTGEQNEMASEALINYCCNFENRKTKIQREKRSNTYICVSMWDPKYTPLPP